MIKKALCLCMSVLLVLLVSCGAKKDDRTVYFGYISSKEVVYGNGLLLSNFGRGATVKYLDFDSLVSVPICPKPNCPHTDESECSALGIYGTIFVYNDSLCWFASDFGYDDEGNLTDDTALYMANTDGTNRRQIAELNGYYVRGGAFVYDGKVYFCATEVGYADGISSGYDKHYLYRYDFLKKRFEEIHFLSEGYGSGSDIRGSFGNSLLIIYQGTPDASMKEDYDSHRKFGLFDLVSGEIELIGKFTPAASEDCLVCFEDDGKVSVTRLSGEKIIIDSDVIVPSTFNDYKIINDKLLSAFYGAAYDLKTGREYALDNSNGYAIAYHNGKYILKNNATGEFSAVSEEELFIEK